LDIDSVRTPGVQNRLQFGCDQLNGFVPGDSLELALTAPSHALQGISKALGIIEESSQGSAFEAASKLRSLLCVGKVIISDSEDSASTNMSFEMAPAPTVVVAEHRGDPKLFFLAQTCRLERWGHAFIVTSRLGWVKVQKQAHL